MSRSHLSAPQPNERLKRERLLRGWSQVDIANTLATDGYTVNRWERGRAQPSSYFRRKLCELFGKNAYDLGLVSLPTADVVPSLAPSASDSFLSVSWPMFPSRNPYFTGREKYLQSLYTLLAASRSGTCPQVIALSGLGGVGKTQVAIEYAYQYAPEYTAILWIEAAGMESVLASMVCIATALQLPVEQEKQHYVLSVVRRWLTTHNHWLIIWDNLEDLDLLGHLALPTQKGAMLITTRNQACGTLAHGLSLEPMEQEEGTLFLLRRAKVIGLEMTQEHVEQFIERHPGEYETSLQLVTIMGGLPLALDQAGTYIDGSGCGLSNYLQLYQQQEASLLAHRGFLLEQAHPDSVSATVLQTYQRVSQEQEIAANILRICAFLHAEDIPEELFVKGAIYLGLDAIAADLTQFDHALAILRSLSLLQRHPETRTLSIHCLVQSVLKTSMNELERMDWLRRITAALNAVFPEVFSDRWKQGQRFLPHVLAIAESSPASTQEVHLTSILHKTAIYLRKRTKYE